MIMWWSLNINDQILRLLFLFFAVKINGYINTFYNIHFIVLQKFLKDYIYVNN